jgi:uroporphyrinogen-III synthase
MARQSQPVPALPMILLTRPQAQSERFAAALQQKMQGLEVVIAPLMAAKFLLPEVALRNWRAIILTSETGAEAAGRMAAEGAVLPKLAYCVGDRTAFAAREAGFTASSAQGDATALADDLVRRKVGGPLLHLRGKATRGDVVTRLMSAGIEAESLVCYEQASLQADLGLIAVLHQTRPILIPLFSPRSAELFCEQVALVGISAPLWVVAMSEPVADAVSPLRPDKTAIATRPDGAAMVAACLATIGSETCP